MNYPNNIRKIINDIHKEKLIDERYLTLDEQIDREYHLYSAWCRGNSLDCDNSNMFNKYLKDCKIEIDWLVRKGIREKYFGEKFKYDYLKNKWIKVN